MAKVSDSVIYKEAQDSFDFADDDISYFEELDMDSSASDQDIEVFSEEDGNDVYFSEEALDEDSEPTSVEDALDPFIEGDDSLAELGRELIQADDDLTSFSEEHGDEDAFVPGSDAKEADFADDSEDEEEEGDYLTTGNIKKFMEYIKDMYPTKIPRHDGKTTLGCERAKSFLERMDKEISTAIRKDHDGVLDISELESVRQKIMSDVSKLVGHIKLLKSTQNKKKASVDASGIPAWTNQDGVEVSYDELRKSAATPNKMVIAVPPFERAIAGIMINAHVSAGHNMEDVYEYLSKKYGITAREELSIMQVCMDSGFHIFKDRGTYSGDKEDEKGSGAKRGVDFIRNYFA